jgi:hypothetical protein
MSTLTDIEFTVTNVYAPADHSDTPVFLDEMRTVAAEIDTSWTVVGDFNLIRDAADKNNNNINTSLCQAFNDLINELALLEIPLLNHRFTWSNKRTHPTLARLDRVFFNTEMNHIFPGAELMALIQNCKFLVLLLDTYQETRALSPAEAALHRRSQERLELAIKEQAARWKQCAKCREFREGDANTAYFHACPNTPEPQEPDQAHRGRRCRGGIPRREDARAHRLSALHPRRQPGTPVGVRCGQPLH